MVKLFSTSKYIFQRLGAGSEDSNLSASNPNASDSGSPVTRPGSVELINISRSTIDEEKVVSPENEPKAKKKSRFDQAEPEEPSPQKEKDAKEEKKLGKKNDWDMFAEADNFGTALNVSSKDKLMLSYPTILLCIL